ncbi:MAG: thymidine kinase [Patescibacteria group bacterium]
MSGSITFFTGPMACGKTLELVRHLQIYAEQRVSTICLRPALDTRSARIESRSGLAYDGLTVPEQDLEAIKLAMEPYRVIGLDEMQFFTPEIVPLLHEAMKQGKTILISGLDADFRGAVFPTALALMALPETIVQRSRAVCSVCREHNATRTQRLRNGEPVHKNDPVVTVEHEGEAVTYEPRCVAHHVVIE